MNYETLFVNPTRRTSRAHFIGALVPMLAALAFYYFLVWGPTGRFGFLVLLIPAFVLHARRLHDMGRPAWLLLAPAALIATTFWLRMGDPGTGAASAVTWAALVVSAAFVLWGAIGEGRHQADRSGKPAAA